VHVNQPHANVSRINFEDEIIYDRRKTRSDCFRKPTNPLSLSRINRSTLSDVIRFRFYLSCRAVARLGDLDLDPEVDDGATPLDVPIDRVITHERYLYGEKHINDIALVVLRDDVTFTSKRFGRVFFAVRPPLEPRVSNVLTRVPHTNVCTKRVIFCAELVRPICMPIFANVRNVNYDRKTLTVTGWGSTFATELQERSMTYLLYDVQHVARVILSAGSFAF